MQAGKMIYISRLLKKPPSALSSSKLVIAAYMKSTPHSTLFDSSHLELFSPSAADLAA
jgi:hypothetical protein